MAALMYGTGLRVIECVSLRVQAVDFGYRQIRVYNGNKRVLSLVSLFATSNFLTGHPE